MQPMHVPRSILKSNPAATSANGAHLSANDEAGMGGRKAKRAKLKKRWVPGRDCGLASPKFKISNRD